MCRTVLISLLALVASTTALSPFTWPARNSTTLVQNCTHMTPNNTSIVEPSPTVSLITRPSDFPLDNPSILRPGNVTLIPNRKPESKSNLTRSGGTTWRPKPVLSRTSSLPIPLPKKPVLEDIGTGADDTFPETDSAPTLPPHGSAYMTPQKRHTVHAHASRHDVPSAFSVMALGVMIFVFVIAVAVKVGLACASYNEIMWTWENGEDDVEAQPLFAEHARVYLYG